MNAPFKLSVLISSSRGEAVSTTSPPRDEAVSATSPPREKDFSATSPPRNEAVSTTGPPRDKAVSATSPPRDEAFSALASCLDLLPLQKNSGILQMYSQSVSSSRPATTGCRRGDGRVLPPPVAELVEVDDDLETEAEGVELRAVRNRQHLVASRTC